MKRPVLVYLTGHGTEYPSYMAIKRVAMSSKHTPTNRKKYVFMSAILKSQQTACHDQVSQIQITQNRI